VNIKMSEENKIGEKIRHVRENNEMSVKELADTSHCSVEFIEDLESGAYIPSLTPLLKIARALGVRLGTFLDDAPQTGPFMVKSGKSENIIHFSGSYNNLEESTLDFYSLAYGKQDRHMEPFIIEVTPKTGGHKLS
jgi:transcriptional regulator with XRE-family HTH domain